jgi:hypothetical protein
MHTLLWPPPGRTAAEVVRIFVHALMRIPKPDPEAGNCPGDGMHWYCLIGVHATNRLILCSLICNRDLACGEGTRLDCCNVITAASELGMTIITLSKLYFVLFYRPTPTDITVVQHERHAAARPHALDQVTPSSGVGSKAIWSRLFSGLSV